MNRRGFLTGVAGLLAAPAIVRAGSLMPVSAFEQIPTEVWEAVQLGATGGAFTRSGVAGIGPYFDWAMYRDGTLCVLRCEELPLGGKSETLFERRAPRTLIRGFNASRKGLGWTILDQSS